MPETFGYILTGPALFLTGVYQRLVWTARKLVDYSPLNPKYRKLRE